MSVRCSLCPRALKVPPVSMSSQVCADSASDLAATTEGAEGSGSRLVVDIGQRVTSWAILKWSTYFPAIPSFQTSPLSTGKSQCLADLPGAAFRGHESILFAVEAPSSSLHFLVHLGHSPGTQYGRRTPIAYLSGIICAAFPAAFEDQSPRRDFGCTQSIIPCLPAHTRHSGETGPTRRYTADGP